MTNPKANPLFCIDTSAFSRSWHTYYDPNHFPTLWEQFEKGIKQGQFVMPEQVYDELIYQKDKLTDWVKPLKKNLVVATDAVILAEMSRIANAYPKLCQHTKGAEVADPYVVAIAKLKTLTVITEEGGKRFKIPDVCIKEGVACQSFSMTIKQLGWRF